MSSNQQSSSSFSSVSYVSSSSSSSSSSSNGVQNVSGSRSSQTSYSDPSGTHVVTQNQQLGEPVVREERSYDAQGREQVGGSSGGRIEDVSEEQKERDREYEERMEEEYAKREGGA